MANGLCLESVKCSVVKMGEWEKRLYKKASLKWLQAQYKKYPRLFPHWELVHP
jgi:hypothetical protein